MYKQVEKLNFLTFHLQSFISIKCLGKFPVVWAAVSPPTIFLLSTHGAKTLKLRRATGPLTDSWSVTLVMCLCPSFLNARHRLPAWEIVAGEQQRKLKREWVEMAFHYLVPNLQNPKRVK